MKTQIGYKVVRVYPDKLVSASATDYQITTVSETKTLKMHLEYKLFKKTIPKVKGTKLFAFLNLEDAIKYIEVGLYPKVIVYKAKLYNPIESGWLKSMFTNEFWNLLSFDELLDWFNHPEKHNKAESFPSCCICSGIMLLEEVYSEQQ